MKTRTLWTPRRLRSLRPSSQFLALSPFRAKQPKPESLPAPVGLDPQGDIRRFLGGFPSADGEESPVQEHRVVLFG